MSGPLPDALFDALMGGDDALWEELGDEAAAALLCAAVEPEPHPAGAREALLQAAAPRSVPAMVAELFQIGMDVALEYIDTLGDVAQWVEMAPGIRLRHVEGGPALAAADVGFVELAEGVEFPWHNHHGPESTFVLEGTLVDSTGRRASAGETLDMEPGSRHSFHAEDGPLLFAVVAFDVTFDDFAEVPGHD